MLRVSRLDMAVWSTITTEQKQKNVSNPGQNETLDLDLAKRKFRQWTGSRLGPAETSSSK